jgi:hypothetical protein
MAVKNTPETQRIQLKRKNWRPTLCPLVKNDANKFSEVSFWHFSHPYILGGRKIGREVVKDACGAIVQLKMLR